MINYVKKKSYVNKIIKVKKNKENVTWKYN
jgi:hypothetical protein